MDELMYNRLVICPHCGSEAPDYEDCVLCGRSFRDIDTPPREIEADEIQKMMMDAKLQEIQVKRGMLLGDTWDHAAWLERLKLLAEIAPEHPKVHYYIGAALTEMGEYRQAIVSFTRALTHDPAMADAIRRRGDCQYLLVPVLSDDVQVYYDRALADYEAALELEPDVYTYNVHGSVISSLGRVEEAIQEYDQAIEVDPDYSETYFNRGYAYKLLGEVDKAVADFERFLTFEKHWNEEMVSMAQSHIKELTQSD
ncbi:MAG: tetratricopeptide repeat protein [Anaerolineae bacterium]|nr:tetratricopeptide repeat protein [Anaerolineae bacterium]